MWEQHRFEDPNQNRGGNKLVAMVMIVVVVVIFAALAAWGRV